jgi:uncharacterized protein YjgD (DUF1641 family)
LPELIETVRHLSANGTLRRIRVAGDLLNVALQGVDVEAASAAAVAHNAGVSVDGARKVLRSLGEALDDAHRDEHRLGGYRGLVRLLRDPEVQVGLRALSVLPVYIERNRRGAGQRSRL